DHIRLSGRRRARRSRIGRRCIHHGSGGVPCVKGIIIGAGRGRRLVPLTEDTPKCFAEIGGKRLIDWARESFAAIGLRDLVFIGGYQMERVRAEYPEFIYCHNRSWETNNILASPFHAEPYMAGGSICAYSD